MCNKCIERKSSGSLDVSIDDLKRSRSPLGPHRSKLVIICLTFQLLLRTYGGVGRWDQRKRVTVIILIVARPRSSSFNGIVVWSVAAAKCGSGVRVHGGKGKLDQLGWSAKRLS